MLPQITKVRKDFYTLNSTIAPSFNKMVELVAKLPEAPSNLTDVNNFNANMKRFIESCKVDIDTFRQFQHPETPISFDAKIEFAEWEDSGVNWIGMRDIATKRAQGICWRINANGDSRLAQWKNGSVNGLSIYIHSYGKTSFGVKEGENWLAYLNQTADGSDRGSKGETNALNRLYLKN